MTEAEPAGRREYEFQAETRKLLDLLVHSVYTSKDIFIRELVSNAADALEKVRFAEVRGDQVQDAGAPLEIRIEFRPEEGRKHLVVADTGIGMTEEEVRANLGTIARSGAAAFLERLGQGERPDLTLIGQFGIGFYSAFMVADQVRVTTRAAAPDAAPVAWSSDGQGTYAIEPAPGPVPRGTQVDLLLKEDETRFADTSVLSAAIRRYSNFVPFPIHVEGEQVNRTRALWREPPSQVSEEEATEFYKFLCHDPDAPLTRVHFATDSPLQFSALLFVPARSPELLGFGQGEVQLQLYARRVLIDPENSGLLPRYLRFVKGVVESEDLPLNISRETLQENPHVRKMREILAGRVLDALGELAKEDAAGYARLWRGVGPILKEGVVDASSSSGKKVQELLRFDSSHLEDAEGLTSLAEYVERMREGQTRIYFLSGSTREALERDPRLEIFRKKGIEVLYLHELADELVLHELGRYQDRDLVSADQVRPEDLKGIGDDEEAAPAEEGSAGTAEGIDPLVARCKEILGDRVTDVRVSERLVDSPACLVTEEGMSGHMDRIIRLMHKTTDLPRRILEINPSHSLIQSLARLVARDARAPFVSRACEQLFEGAMLLDGYVSDPHRLVERMQEILTDAAALEAGRGEEEAPDGGGSAQPAAP